MDKTALAMLIGVYALLFDSIVGSDSQELDSGAQPMPFKIEISRSFSVGSDLPFLLSLENVAAQNLETYPLETAEVKFLLRQYSSGRLVTQREARIGGDTQTHITGSPGKELVRTEAIRRQKIILQSGAKVELQLDLARVFERHLEPGPYVIEATYEGQFVATTSFRIMIYYAESVPALIRLMKEGVFEQRVWARNMLNTISGQPEWTPRQDDPPEKIENEIEKVHSWWMEHRALIELINRQLVPIEEDGGR